MIFRWWMAPVVGVGLCAIANGVLITTALHVRPQKVEDRPYAASALEDDRAAARAAFAARGWRLDAVIDGAGCILTLQVSGIPPVAGVVELYRPDDSGADRSLAWSDPAQPLHCPLPRRGAWSLRVLLRDAEGAVLAHALRVNRP